MDLISRQAAIDVLSQYPFEKVVNCISILEELPSAQPERNKGEWLEWWPGEAALIMTGEEMLWMCSVCEAKFTERKNFCPNCGADMRGEKDE